MLAQFPVLGAQFGAVFFIGVSNTIAGAEALRGWGWGLGLRVG